MKLLSDQIFDVDMFTSHVRVLLAATGGTSHCPVSHTVAITVDIRNHVTLCLKLIHISHKADTHIRTKQKMCSKLLGFWNLRQVLV
jgi:hypothetical protein